MTGFATSMPSIRFDSTACVEFTCGYPAWDGLTIRAVFVKLRLLKIFLLRGDTDYRIRGNGKIAYRDGLTN